MTRTRKALWMAVAALVLLIAACREDAQGPANSSEAQTATAGDLGGPPVLEGEQALRAPEAVDVPDIFESLAELSSYRMVVSIQFDGASQGNEPGRWRVDSQLVVSDEPSARQISVSSEGLTAAGGLQAMTAVQVGQETFLQLPGLGCITSPTSETPTLPAAADPNSLVAGLTGARLVSGQEIINGMPSNHYVFDDGALPHFAGQAVNVDGALFVAAEGGYLTRLELTAQGEGRYLGAEVPHTGTLTMRLDVTDVNQPVQIQPPPACTQASIYPLVDDAFNVTTIEDLASYDTVLAVDEVAAFYESQMPLAGWSPVEEPVLLDDAAFLTYSRDGVIVTVSVEGNGEGQPTSVLVSP